MSQHQTNMAAPVRTVHAPSTAGTESAFPLAPELGTHKFINQGISVRDYFAAEAMQGLVAASGDSDGVSVFEDEAVAQSAYRLADAMLCAKGVKS